VKSNCAAPVPLKATLAGTGTEAEATARVPVAVPLTVGVNITPAVQLAPAARLLVQVFCVRLKGAAVVSVSAVAAKLPVLVTVTVCAALEAPVIVDGKVNFEGLTPSPVVTVPLPFSGTESGVTPSVDEESTSVAALPPDVAGVKITCTVQLLPLFRAAPQVLVPIA
jgi:hypothetical protein